MGSFFIAFNAIMPVTLIVIIGYFFKSKQFLDKSTISKVNTLCYKFLIPTVTFSNILHTNINEIIDFKLLIYVFFSIIVSILLASIIIPFFEKNRKKQGSIIQAIYRSNFVLLGIPISNYIAGEKASAVASILIMVVIPAYNALAVVILSIYGGKEKLNMLKLFKQVITNPMIIGSFLGIICSMIGLKLPRFLDKTVLDIAKLGSVLPILMLGASLDFSTVSSNLKNLIIGLSGKLFFVPLIFLSTAIQIGFSKEKLVALISVYCSPVAVISAIMAEQMGCDGELATQYVVFSTVISCITIFFWVFTLSIMNII